MERTGSRLIRKQILLTPDQDRWLTSRAQKEGRSESAILRALIDEQRITRVRDRADPLDGMVGTIKGKQPGHHDTLLYGREFEGKRRRASS